MVAIPPVGASNESQKRRRSSPDNGVTNGHSNEIYDNKKAKISLEDDVQNGVNQHATTGNVEAEKQDVNVSEPNPEIQNAHAEEQKLDHHENGLESGLSVSDAEPNPEKENGVTSQEQKVDHHENGFKSDSPVAEITENLEPNMQSVDAIKKEVEESNGEIKNHTFAQNGIISDDDENGNEIKIKTEKKQEKKSVAKAEVEERCDICGQYLHELTMYDGHPTNAVDEYITLTDERLMLFTGSEGDMHEIDVRPVQRITYFSVYDKNGHLVRFDTGLIETNKLLYFSGYVKPVYDDSPSIENGLPTKDIGPINEWYMSGFDGGEKVVIGFSTGYGEYYLQEPSEEYQPIMDLVNRKVLLTKVIIEFLMEEGWQHPSYEDLLQRLEASGDPDLTEDALLANAQFICDRVNSFDTEASEDEELLITIPCMRTLVKMVGVTFKRRQRISRMEAKGLRKKQSWSKATTTNLVREVFETFFVGQIDEKEKAEKGGPRRKRCGICEACQTPDCGQCNNCRNMLKFGGNGRSKQACLMRRCPNMAIQQAEEESEAEEEQEIEEEEIVEEQDPDEGICEDFERQKVEWIGEPLTETEDRVYFTDAKVGDLVITLDDYVMLEPKIPSHPLIIAQIRYMWESTTGGAMMHVQFLCRGIHTVLGETADPRELFVVYECGNCRVDGIVRKANVEFRSLPENWATNGGLDQLPPQLEDNGETFFYAKQYETGSGRFEDIPSELPFDALPYTPCKSCLHQAVIARETLPQFEESEDCINWKGDAYRIGTGVFLDPDSFNIVLDNKPVAIKSETKDWELYPEYYRKPAEYRKGSNTDTPEPFCIGIIEKITKDSEEGILIDVRKLYRPENTSKGIFLYYQLNLNMLYWSDEVVTLNFTKVTGKCYISSAFTIGESPDEWCAKGPYRFYFAEAYDSDTNTFSDLPNVAYNIGRSAKGKGQGKGLSKTSTSIYETPPNWQTLTEPLKCMDVFAGCGGLSEGLHQSGIAVSKWGIEKEPSAARAFKLNNPDAMVFTDDCNELLRIAMSGEDTKGKVLPQKGEVELLVGGPPCQGFSGMNRFNAGQYSLFKNSLIISYLSYCDYYRPKYFILENVRNFVSFKRSMVLKLTLRCLIAIGYQVTFGVCQAGHYGVPQTRRRLIIIAAAPGYALPKYPEPQHVFNKKGCQLSVVVDSSKFSTGVKWGESAPYRTITVRDAMSDLPEISNGCNAKELQYDGDSITHFQRLMRHDDHSGIVKDHICKDMAPIVAARMSQIPTAAGSDWRDLPNIVMHLSDGTQTVKLRYPYCTKRQTKKEVNRGVCACATGKPCNPSDRQFNTLIPWCLPHTADRHNHWAGLYGRLEWDGFFSTTVTNPEPMGKQGRVLHPEQHRVVSVRECARSQGFPDRYQFYGNILDKHRQVGNAVPPPLGAALGREILKAYTISKTTKML